MKYKTIYADPPWQKTGAGKIPRGAQRHYPLMKFKEIVEYMKQIPIDDNAHLYLWVTNNYLVEGIQLMKELGFKYITNRVWIKDKIGLGNYFRGQHEILLFGVKGKLPFKKSINNNTRSICNLSTVINAKRKKHSQKPKKIYREIEETSYPPFVEVFARERFDGWDCYGNEVPSTIQKMIT